MAGGFQPGGGALKLAGGFGIWVGNEGFTWVSEGGITGTSAKFGVCIYSCSLLKAASGFRISSGGVGVVPKFGPALK